MNALTANGNTGCFWNWDGIYQQSVASFTLLHAFPNRDLGPYTTNTKFHSVLNMLLHVPFWPSNKTCEACGRIPDRWRSHATGYKGPENMNKDGHEDLAEILCSLRRNTGF